jgi:periplasmic protein CpxP/Spy
MIKPNLSALIVGTATLALPNLPLAIIQTIIPCLVSAQDMSKGPDFSRLSLSVEQQKQLKNIQLEMKPQVMAVLNQSQKTQLEAKLARGQSLFQGMASLNVSEEQKSKLQGTMRYKMFKIFSLLTPEQRSQLMRSAGKPPF